MSSIAFQSPSPLRSFFRLPYKLLSQVAHYLVLFQAASVLSARAERGEAITFEDMKKGGLV
ncbi:hypothetical protein [Telmatospirillum sp. J64-1]|uniref:hypothetical protein n=1 Tax=Telmatospirillum sp. J64-1 TaxID=2502183 RepID=UPI00115F0FA4|nr:hypothetical protein [Telmatospirillum sp. J64-1]